MAIFCSLAVLKVKKTNPIQTQTKPILSFSVQRAVFSDNEFEKTNPFLPGMIGVSSYNKRVYGIMLLCWDKKNKPNSKFTPSGPSGQALSAVEWTNFLPLLGRKELNRPQKSEAGCQMPNIRLLLSILRAADSSAGERLNS